MGKKTQSKVRSITKSKQRRKTKSKQRRKHVELNPVPPESQNEDCADTELKALDFLNILTREHLKKMLKEYEIISFKHNRYLNIPYLYNSCSDLKMEEVSRLNKLKIGFSIISKDERENTEVMQKGKLKKKNYNTGSRKSDLKVYDKIQDIHKFNIEAFTRISSYRLAGFNKFRFDQCPNVNEKNNILETGGVHNSVLQETMLSLKITKEHMISEAPVEENIRILAFGFKQERMYVEFSINIPDIKEHDDTKISLLVRETNIGFYVSDLNGKSYTFEVENFANRIDVESTNYVFTGKHSVAIRLIKNKHTKMWKQLFTYRNQTKDIWEKEMMTVWDDMNPIAQAQMEPLEFIWNIAQILVNCRADLLNLPHDLNHVNQSFENLEEMIIYYKVMISKNPHLKALIYILGGALYSKLMKSRSTSLKKPPKKNDPSEYEKETVKNITAMIEENLESYKKVDRLYNEGKFEEAISFFEEAHRVWLFPGVFVLKSFGLLEMGRSKEAVINSIFALRNLGSHDGYAALLVILKYNIENGSFIHAIDMAISLEHSCKQLNENQIQALKTARKNGLCMLINIFKSHSLILKKKYKDAIPFLENAESIKPIKCERTNVILLLLYFVCKNYKKVSILGNKILKDNNSHGDLVHYLLEMSAQSNLVMQ